MDALRLITEHFNKIVNERNIFPLSVGGDHLVSLPVLRAVAPKYGSNDGSPLGLVHIDAHCDTWDSYFGESNKYSHGTGFRRAIEEGLIDPKRTIQIGLRGALYADALDDWGVQQGITQIDIDDYRQLGMEKVIERIHSVVGTSPAYVSFDIDVLDPAFACGTGTPEVGGINTHEAQCLIRGLSGLHLVGGDLVEISPSYDPTTNTSLAGATLLYEILCVLAESIAMKESPKKKKPQ
jgi:guanidinopropionase